MSLVVHLHNTTINAVLFFEEITWLDLAIVLIFRPLFRKIYFRKYPESKILRSILKSLHIKCEGYKNKHIKENCKTFNIADRVESVLVKKFINKSYEDGIARLIIVTGKGSRSKVYSDPYRSEKMSVLKHSVP